MQEQFLPQMDPEPEMGAAAAAVCDTLPLHLRQNPSPTPSETATDNGGSVLFSPLALAQMMEMITQAMRGETQQMNETMEKKMDGMTQTMREEMQCMGAGLQEGQEQLKGEIGKNMTAVEQFKIGQGELLRATCWGRLVEVTEEVTGTCTREIRHVEVTEYTETRKIGERLHGVEEGDAHTHS